MISLAIQLIHLRNGKKHLFMPFSFFLNILKNIWFSLSWEIEQSIFFHCIQMGIKYKGEKIFPNKAYFTLPTFIFLKNSFAISSKEYFIFAGFFICL